MCGYKRHFYVYSSCSDYGMHFFRTVMEGNRDTRCPSGPHESYILVPGNCPQCTR